MSKLWYPPGTVVEHGPDDPPAGLKDDLIATNVMGGPLNTDDVRMIFDRKSLEHLLDVAKSSMSGRVILHHAGIKQRIWRTGDQHIYQTLSVVSDPPKPESTPFDDKK